MSGARRNGAPGNSGVVLSVESGVGLNEVRKGWCEEHRPDEAGHTVDPGDGALQLTLFRTVDPACHEGLRAGPARPQKVSIRGRGSF